MTVASNFARRLVGKHDLEPPIDIRTLVRNYADLIFADIPFDDADGISLNLKVLGRTTRIIVNHNMPVVRQRFTMAHELGHVIIPWHVGTIIDHVDPAKAGETSLYWEIEEEANTFAAELLMPKNFIEELILENKDFAKVNKSISKECQVSPISSSTRLSEFAPINTVYAYERRGLTEFSGRTNGTIASALNWGDKFPDNPYDYATSHFHNSLNGGTLHWWVLPSEIHHEVDDERSWREILNCIVNDIGIHPSEAQKVKLSVNGVVAYANGACKRSSTYTVDSVVSAGIQRFKDRGDYKSFVAHKDFNSFLVKKAQDLVNNR